MANQGVCADTRQISCCEHRDFSFVQRFNTEVFPFVGSDQGLSDPDKARRHKVAEGLVRVREPKV